MDAKQVTGFLKLVEPSNKAWTVTSLRREYGNKRSIVVERMDRHLASNMTWAMRVFSQGVEMYYKRDIATVIDAIAMAEDWITRHPHPDEEQECKQ